MSIYATILSIEDLRQTEADLTSQGVGFGVIGDTSPEDYDAPIIYQGSHVLPSDDDPRGGSVSIASIPGFITRGAETTPTADSSRPWLRLSLDIHPSTYEGYLDCVLTRAQVERLAQGLTEWLEHVGQETTLT